jgi:hypothetical protein
VRANPIRSISRVGLTRLRRVWLPRQIELCHSFAGNPSWPIGA